MLGEVTLEQDLRLGWVFGPRFSEFTDQPVLEGSPQPLDSALGLWGAGRDQGHPELLQPSAHLGGRTLVLQLLLQSRFSIGPKDRVTVGIDRLRQTVLLENL